MSAEHKLYKLILAEIDEKDLKLIAQKIGVDYTSLPSKTFMGKSRRLTEYVIHHGQFNEFLHYCHEIYPDLPWLTIAQEIESHFATAFAQTDGSSLEHLRLVLYSCFNPDELFSLAEEFDIDPKKYPYPLDWYETVEQLTDSKYFVDVLKRVKTLRPFLPQAQTISPIFTTKTPTAPSHFVQRWEKLKEDATKRTKKISHTVAEKEQDLQFLIPILEKHLTMLSLKEICFDCAIAQHELTTNHIVGVLEQSALFYYKFLFACQRHKPEVDWAKLVSLESGLINKSEFRFIHDSWHKRDYDTFQVRLLCMHVWHETDDVIDFCLAHFPMVRASLSIEMSFRESVQALIGATWRRGLFSDFLETLKRQYPAAYSQFSPYTPEE